jgi:hypothetical protein
MSVIAGTSPEGIARGQRGICSRFEQGRKYREFLFFNGPVRPPGIFRRGKPGTFTDSPNRHQAGAGVRDELFDQVSKRSLVKRVGLPDDVAEGFLYLMKQQNGTGQSLLIDGGAVLV